MFPAALLALDDDQWDAFAAARAGVSSGPSALVPTASQDPAEGRTR